MVFSVLKTGKSSIVLPCVICVTSPPDKLHVKICLEFALVEAKAILSPFGLIEGEKLLLSPEVNCVLCPLFKS